MTTTMQAMAQTLSRSHGVAAYAVTRRHGQAKRKKTGTTLSRARKEVATRKYRKDAVRLLCPHCSYPAVIRTSSQITTLTRESMYSCTNLECGHTFVALTEIVRTLSPSATPNPAINLPLSSHVRRDLIRATVDNAATAAHTAKFTSPVTGDLFAGGPPPD